MKIQKLVPYAIVAGSVVTLASFLWPRAKEFLDFRNHVDIFVEKVHAFDFVGGLFGNFRFKVDLKVSNPTNSELIMKKPYITAFIDGQEVGQTDPSAETVVIKNNDYSHIRDIRVNIPLANIGHLIDILTALKNGNQTGKTLALKVLTELNGVPFQETVNYQI